VGGFASGPTLEMANRMGIPILVQEQNSYAGVSNKMLKNKVDRVCVAYEKMNRYFPAEKIRITGNPVRQDIINLDGKRVEGIKHFGFQTDKKTIFVLGGSLGARTLNDSMGANTELLAAQSDVQVLWQAGKLYIEEFQNSATAQLSNVKVQAFIDRMDLAYAMADVVICRAGALTISELCLAGKPAVFVPSPNVSEDHQTKNAMALVEKEAAIIVRDKDATNDMITEALRVLNEDQLAKELTQRVKALAKPNAAESIVNEVLSLVKK